MHTLTRILEGGAGSYKNIYIQILRWACFNLKWSELDLTPSIGKSCTWTCKVLSGRYQPLKPKSKVAPIAYT